METKSFHASTVREALGLVKSELGDEAEILETRVVGAGSDRKIEVRARAPQLRAIPGLRHEGLGLGAGSAIPSLPPGAVTALAANAPLSMPAAAPAPAPYLAERPSADEGVSVDDLARELERVSRNVEGFRDALTQITWITERFSLGVLSDAERSAYQTLRGRGLEASLALAILTDARSAEPASGWLRDRLLSVLGEQISVVAEPPLEGPRVIVFAGSPGAGKTTLIAKLAAQAQLEGVPAVHLATTDLFRVGGASELVTYGKLLGVPAHVLTEPVTLTRMIERLERGWLLVDTSGRSPDDPRQRALLEPVVEARAAVEVHLTLSVTTKPEDQLESARRWSWLTPDRVALTHTDETSSPGSVLSALKDLELPLSYLSSSGTVPDGLELARADRLASWILGEAG